MAKAILILIKQISGTLHSHFSHPNSDLDHTKAQRKTEKNSVSPPAIRLMCLK
ncbi:hypothetical protein J2X06_002211 [Lysobacter niastensis]|uniref:Uncharacterized protein n=1 Tax=Lysobacter niastensis TaxID=380629 RepID=A0ABU1WCB8_9GAMM|nr:hypothetical protein [Lysobacter niastensis]MDR7135002.1 hypothetical protein [Lysobacter niastensis]